MHVAALGVVPADDRDQLAARADQPEVGRAGRSLAHDVAGDHGLAGARQQALERTVRRGGQTAAI